MFDCSIYLRKLIVRKQEIKEWKWRCSFGRTLFVAEGRKKTPSPKAHNTYQREHWRSERNPRSRLHQQNLEDFH